MIGCSHRCRYPRALSGTLGSPADLRQWVSGSRPSDAGQASADSDEAGLNAGQAVDRVLADLEPAGVALAAIGPPDAWP